MDDSGHYHEAYRTNPRHQGHFEKALPLKRSANVGAAEAATLGGVSTAIVS